MFLEFLFVHLMAAETPHWTWDTDTRSEFFQRIFFLPSPHDRFLLGLLHRYANGNHAWTESIHHPGKLLFRSLNVFDLPLKDDKRSFVRVKCFLELKTRNIVLLELKYAPPVDYDRIIHLGKRLNTRSHLIAQIRSVSAPLFFAEISSAWRHCNYEKGTCVVTAARGRRIIWVNVQRRGKGYSITF